ncbi:956_t:CDS:2 [Racocetra persica]|uniref:956_t:CDS:1 n=1 Tax=Racocetra persica TaxID=160502 RepID=A0ACA9P7K9_9GLOM|nr:956_t:CDS:2 [Racocetra persica]
MNTGTEAVETGIKLARKWGYIKKKILKNKEIIISCSNNFHSRTAMAISMSTNPVICKDFGPYMPCVGPICPYTGRIIEYNSVDDLEATLKIHGSLVAGFLVEPIQGDAGIIVPNDGYLKKCYDLCKKYNVLVIVDKIQTGVEHTGKMLCQEYDGIRADIILLEKALSGGFYPVSAVLADQEIMLCIQPGEYSSTYGGNPLGSAVVIAALEVIKEENLVERAAVLGEKFREALCEIKSPLISQSRGLIAKPTHVNTIHLAPPLNITEKELMESINIIKEALEDIVNMEAEDIPGYLEDLNLHNYS